MKGEWEEDQQFNFIHVSLEMPTKDPSKLVNYAAGYTPWSSVAEFTLKIPGSHQCRDGFKSMKLDESPRD